MFFDEHKRLLIENEIALENISFVKYSTRSRLFKLNFCPKCLPDSRQEKEYYKINKIKSQMAEYINVENLSLTNFTSRNGWVENGFAIVKSKMYANDKIKKGFNSMKPFTVAAPPIRLERMTL